MSYATI